MKHWWNSAGRAKSRPS